MIITVVILVALLIGPTYDSIVDMPIYLMAWIDGFVAAGIIYLLHKKPEKWRAPWYTFLLITNLYSHSNIFPATSPFIPPSRSTMPAGHPNSVFSIVDVGGLPLDSVYWCLWIKV